MRQFNRSTPTPTAISTATKMAERIRFERELFELMDADGDDKVFADEMKEYVQARAEPAATTCRMNLYDTGNGFFMALDAQRRRPRLGAREAQRGRSRWPARPRRQAGRRRRTSRCGISTSSSSAAATSCSAPASSSWPRRPPSSSGTPTGPIWFQRMDRNNDGDLIWNEFLGHLRSVSRSSTPTTTSCSIRRKRPRR